MKKVIAKKGQLTNEEMKLYYDVLSKFLKLLEEVPDHIFLPLFDINCLGVKAELGSRIGKLRK